MDTFEPPAGATLLATGDHVRHQAFRVGERAWGIQWHLEIDRPELESWLDIFGMEGDLLTEWGKSAEEVRAEADRSWPRTKQRGRELFTRFTNARESEREVDGVVPSADRGRRLPPGTGAESPGGPTAATASRARTSTPSAERAPAPLIVAPVRRTTPTRSSSRSTD